jgi:Xaa-Pro aminopeptidase
MDDAISRLRAGITFKEVHSVASTRIVQGLSSIGLMQGNAEEAVAAGAHTLFFPHGLGHMLGLDVHDMESLGEDYVGYSDTIKRSKEFGWKSLRLARELKAGFTLTIEPGIYFIPELIDRWMAENKHASFINYNALQAYRGFGGIRIEDNFLITDQGSQRLGTQLPKSVEAIEALRQHAS